MQPSEVSRVQRAQPVRRVRPVLVVLVALLTVLISAGVCIIAVLVPAPPAALPLIVPICVGCPLFAAWDVPPALSSLRASRSGASALARLRRTLDQIPETEHPLGL